MSQRHGFRPSLQILEDRCVPAIITVTKLDDAPALPGMNLREAIAAANAQDTIFFKQGLEGTIPLTSEILIDKSLVIQGPGAKKVALSGNFSHRIFNITGAGLLNVSIKGLEFRHGRSANDGGAIECTEDLKLVKTVFTGNESGQSGGAIHCTGLLTVKKSSIVFNAADVLGGGISCATADIFESTIAHNSSGSAGGGIHSVGDLYLNTCTVLANQAVSSGGGISGLNVTSLFSTIADNGALLFGGGIASSFTYLSQSTISGNEAGTSGGGISTSGVKVFTSTIAFNRAGGDGGGLALGGVLASVDEMDSATFSSNEAGGDGGGIWSSKVGLEMFSITIAFNRAEGRAGGFFSQDETPTLESCMIAENQSILSSDEDIDNGGTGSFALKNCLIGVEVGVPYTDNGGNLIGTAAVPIDPRLAPLANNGGKTQTHALKKGSPAINAGSASFGRTSDQRGGLFKRHVGGDVDIGAFERQ